MSNTHRSSKERFNKQQILKMEEQFIDCYRNHGNRFFKIFLGLYKGNYKNLLLSSFFFIIKASPEFLLPLITADVINIAISKPENALPHFLLDLLFAIILLLQNIPNHMLHVNFLSKANRSVEAGLRGAMIRQLQQLSLSFHSATPTGSIQSKIMRDVENIEAFSNQIFTTFLRIAVSMTITLAIVISKNITVFFMFLVCVPFACLTVYNFRKPLRSRNREFRKEVEHTSSEVFDMIELVPVTRAHALQKKEIDKLTNEVTAVAERGYRLDFIQSLFGSVHWVIFSLFQVMCLMFTGFLAYKGKITNIGDITLYQTYFTSLIGYVNSIISLTPILSKGAESINSVGEILSCTDIEDNKNKKKLKQLKGVYEFKNVSFNYDNETPVLKGLDLRVEEGETVAFVGSSGSGKTTILNLLIGFYKPTSGCITVDGVDINELDLNSYRRHISVVPQKSILFSSSVKENITYGNPNISKKQLNSVIEAAQLKKVIEMLPQGIETQVGEHGDKLSGGQKQRISIARAIIRDPSVIIFDEATSALDSVSEREIQNAINALTEKRTTFIVAHRLSTIKNADKIAVIKDGRCVEFGAYDELLEQKGEFYELHQAGTI